MPSPSPWWKSIAPVKGGAVDQDALFKLLMKQRQKPWRLSAIASVGDPFFQRSAEVLATKQEVLGAMEVEGATLVVLNCDVDHSSTCTWLLVPGQHLQTSLPKLPVVFSKNTASKGWDDPGKNPDDEPVFINAVSVHTGEVLVTMGDSYNDRYYPSAVFTHDAPAMTQAAPLAMAESLEGTLPKMPKGYPKPRM